MDSMAKIIINGDLASYGRLCSHAAKRALEGDEIIIVNSENVAMSGNKKEIIQKYSTLKLKGGHSRKGPKYSRIVYKMLKRGIRGMIPDYRKGIGKQAFSRIKCYEGIPEELKNEEIKKFPKITAMKYIKLKELSEKL